MGYQVYKVGKRWGGYGVPAVCEYPDCNEEIDRGVSYACGDAPFTEWGCDRYFCGKHKVMKRVNDGGEYIWRDVCERCKKRKSPFPYKPEHPDWIKHLLKDKSWAEWRKKNPEEIAKLLDK